MKRNAHAGWKGSGGLSLNILNDDELYSIHLATLEVMKKTGIFIDNAEARQRLGDAGCDIDEEKKIVKFPPYLVEDAIRSAPGTFVACGRNPEDDVSLEDNRVYFTNFGEGIVMVDTYTGERHPTTKQDAIDVALVCDALSNIDVYERAVLSHDVPQAVSALHNAEASLIRTRKHHFLGPVNGFQSKKLVEMISVIVGGKDKLKDRPLMTFVNCPTSPLRLPEDLCDNIMVGAENHLGNMVLSMVMPGASGPVTLAGDLVVHNSEVLAANTLAQVTRKGVPFVYGDSSCTLDMRTANACVGTPEAALVNAATARLACYYSLPSFIAGG